MRHILFFALLCMAPVLLANVAQPGIWQAGGAGAFTPLFQEDSSAFRQVQMVREQVDIQLYPGFAVVKGSYWLHNTREGACQFRMGYPVNGMIDIKGHSRRNDFMVDSLHHFSVKMNQNEIDPSFYLNEDNFDYSSPDKWYYWPVTFASLDTILLEVYFVVETNNASIREGYNGDKYNAFIYLLESGITWKPPIRQGQIRIQFMDGLTLEDVHGLENAKDFQLVPSLQMLSWKFQDLEPSIDDNVRITYHEEITDFDFVTYVKQYPAYFKQIDSLASLRIESYPNEPATYRSVYKVDHRGAGRAVGFIFLLAIYGPIILGAILLFFLLRWAFRFFR